MGKTACRLAVVLVAALPACSLIRGSEGVSADAGRRRALEYGAQALEQGDYTVAIERIAPVAAICPTDALGRNAMLLLATAELDPRNPDGRAEAAAELAAFQLTRRHEGEWEGALAAQLYTLALDYGATPIEAGAVPDERVIWDRYLDPDVTQTPLGADAEGETPSATAIAQEARADATTRQVSDAADGGPICDVREADDDIALPELGREPLALRTAPAAPAAAPSQPAPSGSADTRELQAEVERLRAELERKDQELDRIRRTLRP